MYCYKCGKNMDRGDDYCPSCGEIEIEKKLDKRRFIVAFVLSALAATGIFVALVALGVFT